MNSAVDGGVLRLAALLLGAALLASQPQAEAVDLGGVQVGGSARELEFICAGCSNPSRTVWSESVFGDGAVSVLVSQVSAGQWEVSAHGSLTGPNSLPVLGAAAMADVQVVPSDLVPKVFLFQASASVSGIQPYRYLGTEPTTYRIEYLIDGTITGGPEDPLLNANAINGGVNVVSGLLDPRLEGPPQTLADSKLRKAGTGSTVLVTLSDVVEFEVQPLDSFTVRAFLSASANSMLDGSPGSAMAGNSLHARFTSGDTSLLEPLAVTPVPEPKVTLLLAAGLGALLAARARRRATCHA